MQSSFSFSLSPPLSPSLQLFSFLSSNSSLTTIKWFTFFHTCSCMLLCLKHVHVCQPLVTLLKVPFEKCKLLSEKENRHFTFIGKWQIDSVGGVANSSTSIGSSQYIEWNLHWYIQWHEFCLKWNQNQIMLRHFDSDQYHPGLWRAHQLPEYAK